MDFETADKLHQDMLSRERGIRAGKAHDYSGKSDVLSNFKQIASILRILQINVWTPWGAALMLVILKITRLANLLRRGKSAVNESVDDTFLDARLYLELVRECLYEERGAGEDD